MVGGRSAKDYNAWGRVCRGYSLCRGYLLILESASKENRSLNSVIYRRNIISLGSLYEIAVVKFEPESPFGPPRHRGFRTIHHIDKKPDATSLCQTTSSAKGGSRCQSGTLK